MENVKKSKEQKRIKARRLTANSLRKSKNSLSTSISIHREIDELRKENKELRENIDALK
jgi:hypothetical protein